MELDYEIVKSHVAHDGIVNLIKTSMHQYFVIMELNTPKLGKIFVCQARKDDKRVYKDGTCSKTKCSIYTYNIRDILLNIEAVRWGILSTADKKFRRLSSMFPIHRYQKVEECETTESVP